MCVHLCGMVCVCVCVCTRARVHTHTHACMNVCVCVYVYVYLDIHRVCIKKAQDIPLMHTSDKKNISPSRMHLHSGSKYPCQRRTKSTQYIHSEEGRGKDDWYVSEMETQGQQG